MAYETRSLPSHARNGSLSRASGFQAAGSGSGPPPLLIARINEKKAELENLKELKELSAQLASQMEMLEQKLSTLSNGTEAVAAVLSNWHNVLRAISMASVKIPKPKPDGETINSESELPLPQTLVRIPVQDAHQP